MTLVYLPATHGVCAAHKSVAAEPEVATLNVPDAQAAHVGAADWLPATEVYLPGPQKLLLVQSSVSSWSAAVVPVLPYLPTAQVMHVSLVCLTATLYLPDAQTVQSSSLSWSAAWLAPLAL